jgi:ectoine hydroxylase-related dioxygenase (phytanoyl-CoA dioxygenase family)
MRVGDVSAFEQVACAIPRTSAVIFHGQLVHKTGENTTDVPRTSGVIRFFP